MGNPARQMVRRARALATRLRIARRPKYFCVGRAKTGTTSLARAFHELGFVVGNQRRAELLAHRDWFRGEYRALIRYCRYAEVFQDSPFGWPGTFRVLDEAFPGSRFILTVRDDEEQWYSSVTRYASRLYGRDGNLPTAADLKRATYRFPGYAYNSVRIHGTSDDDPYEPNRLKQVYREHNDAVRAYFAERPGDLLELNLGQPGAYREFLTFIGRDDVQGDAFPWENRTSDREWGEFAPP